MRKLKIVADSSCDLLTLERADFAFVPMKIHTDQREFTDNEALDVRAMTGYFHQYAGRSRTSCPNPGDWIEAFGDADDVICVTITGALSGSCNAARSAKQIYESEHSGKRVFVLDTLSAGPEITLILRKLEELVSRGMDYEAVCESIARYSRETALVFMLKSLKNFAANGRVSPIIAKIVGIAGICIVGKASEEGTLEPSHKCRGENRSLQTILKDLEAMGLRRGRVSIGHCENLTAAVKLKEMIAEKFPETDIEIHAFRGLCSYYAEYGGVLVGFEKK